MSPRAKGDEEMKIPIEWDAKIGITVLISFIIALGLLFYRVDQLEKCEGTNESAHKSIMVDLNSASIGMVRVETKLLNIEAMLLEIKQDMRDERKGK